MTNTANVPLHRDPRIRGIAVQVVLVVLLVCLFAFLFFNTLENMNKRGIVAGFDFLERIAPFNVGFSPFIEFSLSKSTYFDVFLIGVLNTILISVLGIISATFLGFVIGIMRLSPNWLLSRLALVYIETIRNIPLLLQIMFWYFVVFLAVLPELRESFSFLDMFFLNNRGAYFPKPLVQNWNNFYIMIIAGILGLALTYGLIRWSRWRQDHTGLTFPAKSLGLLVTLGLIVSAYFLTGQPVGFELPVASKFRLSGGIEIPVAMFSLWFVLTIYTSSFIAENVRAGIKAVSHGQTEASEALGLQRKHMLKLVIIPQAMRIITPPTISQFLNLTKNSSLAVAVSYEDTYQLLSISANQTGQPLVIIGMMMTVYLSLSLLTSAFLNFYNKKIQLVER